MFNLRCQAHFKKEPAVELAFQRSTQLRWVSAYDFTHLRYIHNLSETDFVLGSEPQNAYILPKKSNPYNAPSLPFRNDRPRSRYRRYVGCDQSKSNLRSALSLVRIGAFMQYSATIAAY